MSYERHLHEKQVDDFIQFLEEEISPKVVDLLTNASNRKKFQGKIRPFGERWKDFQDKLEHNAKIKLEHGRRVKLHPELRKKNAQPPEEGWVWGEKFLFECQEGAEGPVKEVPASKALELIKALEEAGRSREATELQGNYNAIVETKSELDSVIEEMRASEEPPDHCDEAYDRIADRPELFNNADPDIRIREVVTAWRTITDDDKTKEIWLPSPAMGEWWPLLGWDIEDVAGCWHPPLSKLEESDDPISTLKPQGGRDGRLPSLKDPAERNERCYVVLAGVHDGIQRVKEPISEGIWPPGLAAAAWRRLTECQPYGPDRGFVRDALTTVKAELANIEERKTKASKKVSTKDAGSDNDREPYRFVFVSAIDFEKFLIATAYEVHRLLSKEGARKRFEQQCRDFHSAWTTFHEAMRRKNKKIDAYRQRANRDDRLRNKSEGPPEEDWVWYDDSPLEIGDPRLGFWGPRCEGLPQDPTLRLMSPPDGILPESDAEELLKYYILLVIVHDGMTPSLPRIDRDTAPRPLAGLMYVIDMNLADEGQAIIETALTYVRADLAEKPAAMEQGDKGDTRAAERNEGDEDVMNEREYQAFLGNVADRVSGMIAGKRALATGRFHDNCEAFCKQELVYREAFEQALRKAETEEPVLQDYNDGMPPKPGLEWVESPGKSSTEVQCFWSEPLPFSPVAWLGYYYGEEVPLFDAEPRQPDDDQMRQCEYVVLGLVHDEVKEVAKARRLCTIDNDEWRHSAWDDLPLSEMAVYKQSATKKRRFEDALEGVEADLAQLVVSTEDTAEDQGTANIFKRTGDHWVIRYEGGDRYTIRDSKGMAHIAHLLGKAGKRVPALVLANDRKVVTEGKVRYDEITASPSRPDQILDEDYVRNCQKKLNEIEADLGKAKNNDDEAEAARLNTEKEQILGLLQQALNLNGKSRNFSDATEKARKRVSVAIGRALDTLRKHDESLYKHLDISIERGIDCGYQPDREIDWDL